MPIPYLQARVARLERRERRPREGDARSGRNVGTRENAGHEASHKWAHLLFSQTKMHGSFCSAAKLTASKSWPWFAAPCREQVPKGGRAET